MRAVLLAVLAAFAAPSVLAQAQFVGACAASASQDTVQELDPQRACGCAARRVLADGAVTPAALDGLASYFVDGDLRLDGAPEDVQLVASSALQALGVCVSEGAGASAFERALADARGGTAGPAPVAASAAASAGASPLPAGLRTGSGKGPVRAIQSGPGAPIRILE